MMNVPAATDVRPTRPAPARLIAVAPHITRSPTPHTPHAGSLVIADVLLYSLALMLELASLVVLRAREPELRGAFRIPLGTGPVAVLALFPFSVLLLVVALSFLDGEYGLPAVTGAAVAITLGPLCYSLARRHARAAAITDPA
jgi:amino acid transporter